MFPMTGAVCLQLRLQACIDINVSVTLLFNTRVRSWYTDKVIKSNEPQVLKQILVNALFCYNIQLVVQILFECV